MKFVVLNGSPKGNELSSTMHLLYYLQNVIPGHDYEYFTIAKDIKKIEKDKAYLDRILKSVSECDAVIWSVPVFIYLVPAQVKRFIEIIFERKKTKVFSGKYSTAFLTSAMVFDHTGLNYIHGISEDLGMKFIRGFSTSQQDLEKKECQESLKNFFIHFISSLENQDPVPKKFMPISWKPAVYKAPRIKKEKKQTGKNILLLTDHQPGSNLEQMVETYIAYSKYEIDVFNINDLDLKGPCLDCLQCVLGGYCVYKDGIRDLYEEKIIPADAMIFAGTIEDRYLSSLWKMFFDRSFFNGHRPVLAGKEAALLISGPLRQIPNILQIFEGLFQYCRMEVVGTVTDEEKDNAVTTGLIKQLARNLDQRLEIGGVFLQDFLARGAHVILRDTIYATSAILNADHKYFKKLKLYDFPQNFTKYRFLNYMLHVFVRIPPIKKMIKKDILKFMVMPAQKVVEKASKTN